jgi:hypothetical protein
MTRRCSSHTGRETAEPVPREAPLELAREAQDRRELRQEALDARALPLCRTDGEPQHSHLGSKLHATGHSDSGA